MMSVSSTSRDQVKNMSIADIRQPHQAHQAHQAHQPLQANQANQVQAEDAARPVRSEISSAFVQAYRKQVKESQKTFWARFGVTQSRGSRFELGANIPKPVMILLRLYFEARISDDDIHAVSQKRPPVVRPALVSQDRSTPFVSP
jgi:DNA-binding transcriptional regulator YiaG